MMSWRELSGQILVRASILSIEKHLEWDECKREAARQIAAEEKARAKATPRSKQQQPPPTYTPASSDDDYSAELRTAKDRFFGRLESFFARLDARRATEKAAKKAARKAAKANIASAVTHVPRPSNVIPLPTTQPDPPTPESTHPTAHLVYAGGSTGAVRIEDPRPSPATANWRASIERNERLQQQRNIKS